MSNEIREALEQVSRALGASDYKPGGDQSATATLRAGLGFDVTGPSGQRLQTDMPKIMGGGGSGPGPGWLMRASLASCLASVIAMRAAQEGVALDKLEVKVESMSDSRGMLGVGPKVTAGLLELRTTVRIAAAGASADRLREIVHWADEHSPVSSTLRAPPESKLVVEVG
jgi:uncharacterized OsmC-like protein